MKETWACPDTFPEDWTDPDDTLTFIGHTKRQYADGTVVWISPVSPVETVFPDDGSKHFDAKDNRAPNYYPKTTPE